MNTNENEANPENLTMEDFSAAEHAAVDAMAAPLIKHFADEKSSDKKFSSQNRKAWNRMNRPDKTQKIDTGASIIHSLIDKGIQLNPIRVPLDDTIETVI